MEGEEEKQGGGEEGRLGEETGTACLLAGTYKQTSKLTNERTNKQSNKHTA